MYTELNSCAAYIKGKPIYTVEDLGERFVTNPMNERWKAELQNRSLGCVDEYIMHNPKNGHRMIELYNRLLSFGGEGVCLPVYEQDLVDILDRGQIWKGDRITMMRGRPSQCHRNSAYCWDANKDKAVLCTGYALSLDGCWRQHSWCIHVKPRKNRVVETTVERVAYFGFVMTTEEATQFYFDNE